MQGGRHPVPLPIIYPELDLHAAPSVSSPPQLGIKAGLKLSLSLSHVNLISEKKKNKTAWARSIVFIEILLRRLFGTSPKGRTIV